jgi:hypothetical protein
MSYFYTRFSTLLGLLFFVSACGELPGFTVDEKTDAFNQTAVRNDKVDILFTVDNSGSMLGEQAVLAQSFENFINKFSEKNLNFQVGVLSTDNSTTASWWTSPTGAYGKFPNAGPGSLLGFKESGAAATHERILRPTTSNFLNKFKDNAKLGNTGNGAEAGLKAVTKALSPEMLAVGAWNEGFVRDEALLVVIIVSDEDESMTVGANSALRAQYIRRFPAEKAIRKQEFKDRLASLKPGSPDLIRFAAVINPSSAICTNTEFNGDGDPGTGDVYKEVANELNGVVIPVCNDFSEPLLELGASLVQLLSRFKLKQIPDGQIQVLVNGNVIARDASNGWEYLPASNEVEFRGSAIPSADARIEVAYVPGAPLQ